MAKVRAKVFQLTVMKYDESRFKPRKDVTHPTWYKCSNRLLEDQDFHQFSAEERLFWFRVLEIVSQKQSPTIHVDVNHCELVCRISKKSVLSSLKKLEELGFITVHVTPTLRARNADVTRPLQKPLPREEREEKKEESVSEPPPPKSKDSISKERNPVADFESQFKGDRKKYEQCFAYLVERSGKENLSNFATSQRIREAMAVFEKPEECWSWFEDLADRIVDRGVEDVLSYVAASWRDEVGQRRGQVAVSL